MNTFTFTDDELNIISLSLIDRYKKLNDAANIACHHGLEPLDIRWSSEKAIAIANVISERLAKNIIEK